jgi:hypothetical protein
MKNFLSKTFPNQYQALRRGAVFRFGPLSFIRTTHLAALKSKVSLLERLAARGASPISETPARTKRSVVFLHNSYYNFFYLAAALRKRGWDAISVSIEAPDGEHSGFYHGNDLCLYDADPFKMQQKIDSFLIEAVERFGMVHFYGRGQMAFSPSEFDYSDAFDHWPVEMVRLKQAGVKIGYSVCGCLDGVAQSSVLKWSGCCDRCVWQNNPKICSDKMNLAWGHKYQMMCDLIATEGFPALDYQSGPKVYREPLTTALDSDLWRPDIEIPEKYRLAREPGELIVYHAVGNFGFRATKERNLKGTGAVVAAIERLRSEGMKVRLEFVTDVPSKEVRFIQVQADVIVDQLNYGRYGATAREGMMLGRPTVCYMHKDEQTGEEPLQSIETCPLVSASESTIYDVLRDLLSDERKRQDIGRASREFALKWHGADACAARFEKVYDALLDDTQLTGIKAA